MTLLSVVAGCLTIFAVIRAGKCEVNGDAVHMILAPPSIRPDSNGKGSRSEGLEKGSGDSGNFADEKRLEGNAGDLLTRGLRELWTMYHSCREKMTERLRKMKPSGEKSSALIGLKLRVLMDCLKVKGFRRAEEFLSSDVIPLTQSAELRRNEIVYRGDVRNYGRVDILRRTWLDLGLESLEKFFKEYSLRIHLDGLLSHVLGRGRRRDHRMLAMIMMGFVIMSSVLVPMGFQFLAVLGGKSLLLAKMALIMSAINGLKKIATSNIGYGLYHTVPEAFHHDPHHHGFHEKIFQAKSQDQPDLSYSVVI